MDVSKETLTKLVALVIAVGQYMAELDAGYEGDEDALKRINKMAQDAAIREVNGLAFDAIDLVQQAQRVEDTLYWDTLTGEGD